MFLVVFSITSWPCSVTRKVLREAQHQVSLLVNENRELRGSRDQAVMPAWTANTLDANLVEFRSIQVASMPMQQVAGGKYGNKQEAQAASAIYIQETHVHMKHVSTCCPLRDFACSRTAMHATSTCRTGHYMAMIMHVILSLRVNCTQRARTVFVLTGSGH